MSQKKMMKDRLGRSLQANMQSTDILTEALGIS